MVKALDQGRITDEERYDLQEVVAKQVKLGMLAPRLPQMGRVDEVLLSKNTFPNAERISDKLYQRLTLKPLANVHRRPESKFTFPVLKLTDPLSPGNIHCTDVSFGDQKVLCDIHLHRNKKMSHFRKRQQKRDLRILTTYSNQIRPFKVKSTKWRIPYKLSQ